MAHPDVGRLIVPGKPMMPVDVAAPTFRPWTIPWDGGFTPYEFVAFSWTLKDGSTRFYSYKCSLWGSNLGEALATLRRADVPWRTEPEGGRYFNYVVRSNLSGVA